MIYFSQNNSFLTLERLWNSSGWKITKIVNDLENNHFVLSLMQHFSQNFKVLRYLKKWYICGKISIIPIHYVSIMQLQILQLISSIIFSVVLQMFVSYMDYLWVLHYSKSIGYHTFYKEYLVDWLRCI